MMTLRPTKNSSSPTELPTRVQRPLTVVEVPDLRGYLGERWQANRDNYLLAFDIDHYVKLVEERKHRDWWWMGEQDGKWLESAVLSSAHSCEKLRTKAKAVLNRIVASQEPEGYVGVTSRAYREEAHLPLRGMDAYELYFKLHGLLAAWEQWQDRAALQSATKLGNYLVREIGPGKAEFYPSALRPPENRGKMLTGHSDLAGHAVHYSLEGTLLIDPILRLALATGDNRYVIWSQWVVSNIDQWSGWDTFSNLARVAAGTMGIHEIQPYVHSHTLHMNFLGFLRLYEITGDSSYLQKVAGSWADIASRQMYITGGVSVAEHYERGHVKPVTGHVVETCASMSWLQVTQYLLELTGEVKYADAMERLLWNHVCAAQTIDGDSYRYHTAPNGVKPQGFYHGPDCCTSSGHRMIALLPTFLYGKDEKGLFVNQYAASTVEVTLPGDRRIRLSQHTRYPETSEVDIAIEEAPEDAVILRFRIPGWCADPRVMVNGRPVEGVTPGSYLSMERVWRVGDRVVLNFPMELQWVRSDAPWKTRSYRLPSGEFMHEEVPGDTPPWALTRGPIVYAADTLWWDNPHTAPPLMIGDNLAVRPELDSVVEIPSPGRLVGPIFEADFVDASDEKVRVPLVPFTNIGQWYRPNAPKPDKHAAAQSYAIWFLDAQAPAFQKLRQDSVELREAIARSLDYIQIGDPASEADHGVHGGELGQIAGRAFRHGAEFSYLIKVPPNRDGLLTVTYWGGDRDREFKVIADDSVIGTEHLNGTPANEFFEKSYTIPQLLIEGRTDLYGHKVDSVTIRFRSKNQGFAGAVFGIRVE